MSQTPQKTTGATNVRVQTEKDIRSSLEPELVLARESVKFEKRAASLIFGLFIAAFAYTVLLN